jgi:hypothetical protein
MGERLTLIATKEDKIEVEVEKITRSYLRRYREE